LLIGIAVGKRIFIIVSMILFFLNVVGASILLGLHSAVDEVFCFHALPGLGFLKLCYEVVGKRKVN
jgi:hypothetical protein